MPLLAVPLPETLNRRAAPELMPPGTARVLRNLELTDPGQASRGPGQVRPNFTSGVASTVVSTGAFQRRDGRVLLVWQTAAGSVDLQYDPQPAFLDSDY